MQWTIDSLKSFFDKHEGLSVSLEGEVLFLTNDMGVEAFLTLGEEQILVESLLCPCKQVSNQSAFNEIVLKTHKTLFPLSTIGVVELDGDSYYTAFGALSSQSNEETLRIEVDFLYQNVIGMLECYAEFIQAA